MERSRFVEGEPEGEDQKQGAGCDEFDLLTGHPRGGSHLAIGYK